MYTETLNNFKKNTTKKIDNFYCVKNNALKKNNFGGLHFSFLYLYI